MEDDRLRLKCARDAHEREARSHHDITVLMPAWGCWLAMLRSSLTTNFLHPRKRRTRAPLLTGGPGAAPGGVASKSEKGHIYVEARFYSQNLFLKFHNENYTKTHGKQRAQRGCSAGGRTTAAQRTPPERPRSCASNGPLRVRFRPETTHCNQQCSRLPCKAVRMCIGTK